MENFSSLSGQMQEKNSAYYKSPKTKIYGDFSTYAQSPQSTLAQANAREFYDWTIKNEKEKFEVLEIGVGNGAFAQGFLQEIANLDRKNGTGIASLLRYTLADFSKTIIENAIKFAKKPKNAGNANISSILLDANDLSADKLANSFDLIRCNELFSDLPADVFVNNGKKIMQVMYGKNMETRLESNLAEEKLEDWEKLLLLKMPEGYFIPLNKAAARVAVFFCKKLSKNGWLDIFDYGFYRREDFLMPPQIWNSTLVREFGGQWTVDLNFLYMVVALETAGFEVKVEQQKEYVQKIIGSKLWLKEADEKNGLDYGKGVGQELPKTGEGACPLRGSVEEDDFFYHLRARLAKPNKL